MDFHVKQGLIVGLHNNDIIHIISCSNIFKGLIKRGDLNPFLNLIMWTKYVCQFEIFIVLGMSIEY